MKAVRQHQTGSFEELRYEDAPDPVPGSGEILVRVKAAGINWGDTIHRRTGWDGDPPWIPGLELCCEVVDPCDGPYKAGQRLFGRTPPGCARGYAELAAVDPDRLQPVPPNMTDAEAGGATVTFITAWHAIETRAHVRPGETVLVQSAGGGVGTAAVQLAHLRGARVIATATSDEKLDRVRDLGAEVTVNYSDPSWPDQVRELTGGKGADVVLDGVGEATFAGNLAVLAPRGRLVLYGAPSGTYGEVNIRALMRDQVEIHAFATVDESEFIRSVPGFREHVIPMLASGQAKVIVGRELPLSQAGEAQRLLEERAVYGKVVLIP
ncbi:MAG: zinc-binding dehydrogenase [Chloroflexi bacterium]|nr:zinc-binding dehydrogenase [Chloroflexota bacterium]